MVLLLLFALVIAVVRWIDLEPEVDEGFFFAPDSRALQDARRIDDLFRTQGQLVVIAKGRDIDSDAYRSRIEGLTEALGGLSGVTAVKSVTRGPEGIADARESPLWSRLLLAEDASATHLVMFVGDETPDGLVSRVEAVTRRFEKPGFELSLAGVPYTVEVMRRSLVRDFAVFSGAAAVVFTLAILALFRSWRIALGTLLACSSAVAATLLLLRAAGGGIGLLTANLTTIVFVLTQSHIVFMTCNWRRLGRGLASGRDTGHVAARAWRLTLQASVWSMFTTLLGFAALLRVDAEPLRQLGQGGLLGSAVALAAAYLLFPPFLAWEQAPRAGGTAIGGGLDRWMRSGHGVLALGFAVVALVAAAGVWRLDTDPSLLSYFERGGGVREGLDHLDRHGGSSPLELAVRRADGERLDDGDSYARMWALQEAFEGRDLVGRVVSLPVVMAEGDRMPLSFLLDWDWTLDLLQTDLAGRVADSFVTADRRQALFVLQMVEHRRRRPRLAVVEDLRRLASRRGFEVTHTGGIYYLQGRLAALVRRSLVESLAVLAVLFLPVAWLASRSLGSSVATGVALAAVPAAALGSFGWLGAPLDIVTAPAASVGLGLSADAALHLLVAVRKAHGDGAGGDAWERGRVEQWRGIAGSTGIVALGFGLFALSSFPPTRRFGLLVAVAAVLAAPASLVLLSELARRLAGLRR